MKPPHAAARSTAVWKSMPSAARRALQVQQHRFSINIVICCRDPHHRKCWHLSC